MEKLAPTQHASKVKKIIPALTGIRAIAAYLVFLHHYPIKWIEFEGLDFQKEMHIGVSIFFVLSGFLIAYRYADNIKLEGTWIRKYLINRFARIYPVYFFLLIPTLLIAGVTDFKIWFLNLTLTKGFFSEYFLSGIPQAWSLTVEECFYFSAPIIFILYKKYKSLIPIAIVMLCLLPIIIVIGRAINLDSFLYGVRFISLYTIFGRFFEFFVGIQLARILSSSDDSISRFFQKSKFVLKHKTLWGSLGIIASLIVLALLNNKDLAYGLFHPLGMVFNNFVLPLFVATLFWGLVKESTWFSKLLSTSLFDILGKSSYVFYLIHMGFISHFIKNNISTNLLIIFLLLNVCAIALYKLVEHPLNGIIRKL